MSTTTTPRRTALALAAALTAVLATAACTRTEGATPAPPPATSATTSESTTAPSVTPSTTTTTETTTAAPVPNTGTRTRAPSEVSNALLDTSSFVAGVRVVPTPTGGTGSSGASGPDAVTVTSSNPKCAAFVTGAGGKSGAPGVTGYATRAFQDDVDPFPFLIEEITTVGNPGHAADVLAALDGSTQGCPKVTMKIPGVGSSSMAVSRVTPPAHGDHPTSVRIVGASGPLRGLHITLVATGVQDAVVQLTFIQAIESDIEGLTAAAVERVTKAFTYSKPS